MRGFDLGFAAFLRSDPLLLPRSWVFASLLCLNINISPLNNRLAKLGLLLYNCRYFLFDGIQVNFKSPSNDRKLVKIHTLFSYESIESRNSETQTQQTGTTQWYSIKQCHSGMNFYISDYLL